MVVMLMIILVILYYYVGWVGFGKLFITDSRCYCIYVSHLTDCEADA